MRRIAPLLLALPLAACAGGTSNEGMSRTPINVAYQCEDGQTPVVRYFPEGNATIRLDDQRAVELTGTRAAGGERFTGEDVELATMEDLATLSVGGTSTTCEATDSS